MVGPVTDPELGKRLRIFLLTNSNSFANITRKIRRVCVRSGSFCRGDFVFRGLFGPRTGRGLRSVARATEPGGSVGRCRRARQAGGRMLGSVSQLLTLDYRLSL